MPLQWAATEYNLGAALATLGGRESGTARLQEAVAAFEECLMLAVSIWPPELVSEVRTRKDEMRAEIRRRTAK